jgi:hypothetical protein
MKWARCLSVSILTLAFFHGSARADAPDDSDPRNPYARVDPDGVPLAVTQGPKQKLTNEQIESLRQQAIQMERNRNWLMNAYEEQLRMRSKDPAQKDKTPNLYLQLSMDKNLAKLAGLDAMDPTDPTLASPSLHATPSPSAKSTPALRPEAPASTGAFMPLISPLSPLGTSATQSISMSAYSMPIPSILAPSQNGMPPANNSPAPAPPSHSTSYTDVVDLQTPGMVASKNDPLADPGTPDLSLDSLPNEAQDEAKERQEAATRAELPEVMDADQLHKQETAKLALPVATLEAAKATDQKQQTTPPKAIPVNPEDAPVPVTQQTQLNPVHPPIANPYDILNR